MPFAGAAESSGAFLGWPPHHLVPGKDSSAAVSESCRRSLRGALRSPPPKHPVAHPWCSHSKQGDGPGPSVHALIPMEAGRGKKLDGLARRRAAQEAHRIKELQPEASNRKIANVLTSKERWQTIPARPRCPYRTTSRAGGRRRAVIPSHPL
jgi:hypothetical protein